MGTRRLRCHHQRRRATAIEQAGQAGELYRQDGAARAAARALAIAGEALGRQGRHAQAREQLTAAACRPWASWRRWSRWPRRTRGGPLSADALTLGQALAVDDATLAGLFTTRGNCHIFAGRRPQAATYFREAARLAELAGDPIRLGLALVNLSDTVTATDPAAGAEAARAARRPLAPGRRRNHLAVAVANLAQALLMTGDWDTAEAELAQAANGDGLAGNEYLACFRAWVAALRGEVPAAQAALAGLGDLRATEDPTQEQLPAASPPPRSATPGPPSARSAPSGSAASTCGGRGRWPPAPRTTSPTPPNCWPCSTATEPGNWPRCSAPSVTPGPRPPHRRRRPGSRRGVRRRHRRPARALHPDHLATACSSTPSTCCARTTTMPPGPRSAKPTPSPNGCAASLLLDRADTIRSARPRTAAS